MKSTIWVPVLILALCLTVWLAPSPGVHFVFQYQAQVVGDTGVKLYDAALTSVIDSVHITVVHASC